MKQMLRKKDVWVLLAALIGAFACVTLIQFISGRIDGVASMVFLQYACRTTDNTAQHIIVIILQMEIDAETGT